MNIGQIQKLAEIVRVNGLSALEINEGEISIRLERSASGEGVVKEPSASAPEIAVSPLAPPDAPSGTAIDFNHIRAVKSSLVGLFYAAPAPDAPPFVTVGSVVKKGDVLCVIEAMKLMNEITADQDGEVADVCVHNGDLVEFGQTLFKLC
ncbi:MAG: acetyl-CoA carboxylase biotin carboxyl carrier protein [Clostridia bacterium]